MSLHLAERSGRATTARDARRPLVVVAASLDDFSVRDVRRLQQAHRLGDVHLRLASDELVRARTGRPPALPERERSFLAGHLRYVDSVGVVRTAEAAVRPVRARRPDIVVVDPADDDPRLEAACSSHKVAYQSIADFALSGLPEDPLPESPPALRRVVVTGCFDWLHSGHIQFFLDAAALGELYVVVGSDRNVRLLKGPGHPLRSQDERRYMAQSVRAVHRAEVSTGSGWMDAEPEIARIQPHVYVVNEDGDQPDKRAFCRAHGLDYVVLRRRPHRGLPRRTSTALRGF
ncbi:MAG: adenylyltransferase/cytidyltransferase family protein [Chloroflexi bacterium]|nr:adenylyltransferase/cytidyltransferase family protein [Chloroflexota bacterium]